MVHSKYSHHHPHCTAGPNAPKQKPTHSSRSPHLMKLPDPLLVLGIQFHKNEKCSKTKEDQPQKKQQKNNCIKMKYYVN